MELLKSLVLSVILLAHNVLSATIPDTWQGTERPIVQTTQGLVRGIQSTEGDFTIFAGIPYAKVNASNPFGASLRASVFDEIFEATNELIACPQVNHYRVLGMEIDWETTLDCLILNIYVPNNVDTSSPLPVLLWVHGGAFAHGRAAQHSPRHLMEQGIILVLINYRLGPYGFLCLNTPEVPGNAGLKDQLDGFRWVQQNIAAFGGDPDRVTIAGQSAGGSSVNLQLYYAPEALFSQAIVQSGITTLTLSPNDELSAVTLAQQMGYNAPDPESALQFIINSPTELVTRATEELDIYFGPCVEKIVTPDSFMTTNPIVNSLPRTNIPVMLGVTSMELLGTSGLFAASFRDGLTDFFDVSGEELDRLSDIVQNFYAGDQSTSAGVISRLDQFDTDLVQNYPLARETTKLLAQGVGPLYNYIFEYVSENDGGDRENMRAVHSAELKYLFSYDFNTYGEFNEEEQEVSDRICTFWANFVKTGNPTPAGGTSPILPTVSGAARPYVAIGLENRIEYGYEHPNVAFWDLFYRKYGDQEIKLHY